MTGDLLKIELRNGTDYSSTGVVEFLQPLLNEFLTDYPELPLLLRGDSGFAKPELYEQCETNGVSYVIRLKENRTLRALASDIDDRLTDATKHDLVSYAVCYGEFLYQAGSWKYPRRIVCKVEKPTDQLIHMYMFIVTNMDSAPEELIRFYCKRAVATDVVTINDYTLREHAQYTLDEGVEELKKWVTDNIPLLQGD